MALRAAVCIPVGNTPRCCDPAPEYICTRIHGQCDQIFCTVIFFNEKLLKFTIQHTKHRSALNKIITDTTLSNGLRHEGNMAKLSMQ
jgi:hypothetical protein